MLAWQGPRLRIGLAKDALPGMVCARPRQAESTWAARLQNTIHKFSTAFYDSVYSDTESWFRWARSCVGATYYRLQTI